MMYLKSDIIIIKSQTYCSSPSAGPPLSTSDITIDVSPLWKWGLSLPPEMAIPNPKPGAWKHMETHTALTDWSLATTNRRANPLTTKQAIKLYELIITEAINSSPTSCLLSNLYFLIWSRAERTCIIIHSYQFYRSTETSMFGPLVSSLGRVLAPS